MLNRRRIGSRGDGRRSRWLRYAGGLSAAFGLGVIAGMVLAARLARSEGKVDR